MSLEVGKRAPAFSLKSDEGTAIALKDFKGRSWVVLYFYPKDDTPGCTTEACDFRDSLKGFEKLKAVVLGVSPDSVESHARFRKKHDLNFNLLSDEGHAVCEKYGVWVEKNMYGRKFMGVQRATFLIDPEGKVAHLWPKVKVKGHIEDVAMVLKSLS